MTIIAGRKSMKIAMAAAAVCMALLVFSGNAAFLLSNNHYLYSLAAATATPANARPQIDSTAAVQISADVILYIKASTENMQYASSFTEEELSHLADVRSKVKLFHLLFGSLAAAAIASLVAVLISGKGLGKSALALKQVILASGAAAVAISAILFLLSIDFNAYFTGFHKLLFGSSQWQFPSDYLLVNLFTADFFASFAKAAVAAVFVEGLCLVLVSVIIGKFYNPKATNTKE